MATKTIDLRSDTVTRPSPAMREAMARAEVGDDVYDEDPTVNRLQETAARLLGKEAAIFMPSGTMANQAALHVLTRRGDIVLASEGAHVLKYESGAASALAGLQIREIGSGGLFDAADVHAAVTPGDHHYAPTTVVAIENTQNTAGGRIFPFEQLGHVAVAARDRGLKLHLDGARLFNAVVASGIDAGRWAEPFDTISFCLSKGLGAPVGSLVCSTSALVERVHRMRKMLGGGMRQAGILAAAGLYALENNVARLAEDHAHARRLAAGLERLGLPLVTPPETNIILFRVPDPRRFLRALRTRELLINPVEDDVFRAVTHLDVSPDDIDETLARIEAVRFW